MTNLTNINLTELKSTELKNLAKEYKVKNWWLLNKNSLISALGEIKLDLEDKAAVQKATEEYQEELKETESQETQPTEKKAPKKSSKSPKVEKDEENLVTLKELTAEFHMKGTKARRLLRDADISRPYGGNRWEWDKNLHIDELNMAREYLMAHTKAPKKEQGK